MHNNNGHYYYTPINEVEAQQRHREEGTSQTTQATRLLPNPACFFINQMWDGDWIGQAVVYTCSFILFGFWKLLGFWQFAQDGRHDAHMIQASITTHALWWASFQTPQVIDCPNQVMGDFFSLGSRALYKAITLLSCWHHTNLPFFPSHVST